MNLNGVDINCLLCYNYMRVIINKIKETDHA